MECWNSRRSPVLTRNGVCCSNEPTASAIGAKILEAGGNAADAVVAIAAALNVLQSCMSGLGGDSFALYYDATSKEVTCLEGNGASPANINLEVMNAAGYGIGPGLKPLDRYSGLCVTVPGAAALWEDLVKTRGSLPLALILAPAINLAEQGFPHTPLTTTPWNGPLNEEGERVLRPKGRVPTAGEVLQNPDLAQTMRVIAERGAYEGYYQGRIAEAIVAAVHAHGGVLDLQDLQSHRTKFVKPISVDYKGVRVFETPPPSQGLAALIALRLIEKVEQLQQQSSGDRASTASETRGVRHCPEQPLQFSANRSKRSSVDDTHLVLECMRVACAEALHHIADPLVQSVPTEQLLSDAYITATAQKINLQVRYKLYEVVCCCKLLVQHGIHVRTRLCAALCKFSRADTSCITSL
jgi:gamma-glutamyltranspeptidase/glutathione hydrolase